MCRVRLVAVDRLAGGLVLGFSDGSSGFFPEALLHGTLPQARMMTAQEEDLDIQVLFSSKHG